MILEIYKKLEDVILSRFIDVVVKTEIIQAPNGRVRKLRVYLIDGTLVDVWYSADYEYSFHWEQRMLRDRIYRHDNAPHKKWRHIKTYPKHFHNGNDDNVEESYISNDPVTAMKEFMDFVVEIMRKQK